MTTPSQSSLQLAVQAWCTPETRHTVMDTVLATAFAAILDAQVAKTDLGYNTQTCELSDSEWDYIRIGRQDAALVKAQRAEGQINDLKETLKKEGQDEVPS